ncbi:PQQ-dependent dehydrogenase, methanol/ethanol family [Flavihumibacter profundi]|uniref:PQQ-dependent dehydrogenase, methanol/ethanol family n=1 Tax=Flavihumibacter profundi TaxID=2716883 RepID=UPI001CC3C9AE|nr:PQQ-dependent dehydrogenase, methanol/ethanol family [Flavihumibacter profundi]MBZ5859619.1 PQQ-dependent dehydrogenase, methanol/ethanol family [Flavihumibacter profundi]
MHNQRLHSLIFLLYFIVFIISCKQHAKPGTLEHIKEVTAAIDDKALLNADHDPGNWLSYGRNYSEDRYSPLDQVNKENVNKLGLAWSLDLGFKRGFEATPIVVDGIMYVTGAWSKVYAIDARTGKLIWTYDPKVPGRFGQKTCCDVVNRGVALYKGKVYVGTIDGRLVALDAAEGKPVWEIWTVDTSKFYTITGAPRVVKGNVIIGNGGAEFGVRGYITAYDAETGKQQWRFYTVPGNPSAPFESKTMEMAAKTWTGEWWKYGGGGTCWDAMAYDPDLNLFYVGTGNGSPWSRHHRSPGGGDNLFLSSIVALNPDNGEYVWHYQTTPGENWDFTATQPLILADLEIEGKMRKVIMQAPKNGFFYVIDRTNGKFISGKPYTYINWAKGMSPEGRPIETEIANMTDMNAETFPTFDGGHNWHPMAFNKKNGLVYIPARISSFLYGYDSSWSYNAIKDFGSGTGWNEAREPNPSLKNKFDKNAPAKHPQGFLLAWDPVKQKEVWRVNQSFLWNGGVVTTAAGLVFQGTADGNLSAYDGDNGKLLWQVNVGTGVIAPPISYLVDGVQYISFQVGWGGSYVALTESITPNIYPAHIYTFKIDGKEKMPDLKSIPQPVPLKIDYPGSQVEITKGGYLFLQYCMPCHGEIDKKFGVLPELGHITKAKFDLINDIVRKGALENLGMPNLGNKLTDEDVENIKKYISAMAKEIK